MKRSRDYLNPKIRKTEQLRDVRGVVDQMDWFDEKSTGCTSKIRMGQYGMCTFTSMYNSFGLCLPIDLLIEEDKIYMKKLQKAHKESYKIFIDARKGLKKENKKTYIKNSNVRFKYHTPIEKISFDVYNFIQSGAFDMDFFTYILNKYNKPYKYISFTTSRYGRKKATRKFENRKQQSIYVFK